MILEYYELPVYAKWFQKFLREAKALLGNGQGLEWSGPGMHCLTAGGFGTRGGGAYTTLGMY